MYGLNFLTGRKITNGGNTEQYVGNGNRNSSNGYKSNPAIPMEMSPNAHVQVQNNSFSHSYSHTHAQLFPQNFPHAQQTVQQVPVIRANQAFPNRSCSIFSSLSLQQHQMQSQQQMTLIQQTPPPPQVDRVQVNNVINQGN